MNGLQAYKLKKQVFLSCFVNYSDEKGLKNTCEPFIGSGADINQISGTA